MDYKQSLFGFIDTQNSLGKPGAGKQTDHAANASQALQSAKNLAAASEKEPDAPKSMNAAYPVAN